jgi:hypothetical protein
MRDIVDAFGNKIKHKSIVLFFRFYENLNEELTIGVVENIEGAWIDIKYVSSVYDWSIEDYKDSITTGHFAIVRGPQNLYILPDNVIFRADSPKYIKALEIFLSIPDKGE